MGVRVLIVDDAAFVRDTIKRSLRKFIQELEIFEAQDGKRAISVMKANNIDLVLSDWEMPEMSGEEFLAWVREQPQYAETPFIMVTSRGDRNDVVVAVNAGVSDYLTKPFTPEEIQRKVAKHLKRIGYRPPPTKKAQSNTGFGSVDVLTGGAPIEAPKKREVKTVTAFSKPAAQVKAKKVSRIDGKARLRFPKQVCECEIKDISLQAMVGVIERTDVLPTIFDQAVVDIINPSDDVVSSLNAYLSGLQAVDPRPDCKKLRITIRFVDNDPEKFDALSKVIR